MHHSHDRLIFSATDLSNFLACSHLSLLDRQAALGGPKPRPFDDPGTEVLRQRGQQREGEYLAGLEEEGLGVVQVSEIPPAQVASTAERWERMTASTRGAMEEGADVVYQGAVFDGRWFGRTDFLVKVETPSALGPWSYEVVDTKLAREAKGGAVLQICLYTELLGRLQGRTPERMHLALGGPERPEETFRFADFAAYFRSVKARFEEHVTAAEGADIPFAPEPVSHCDICQWRTRCDGERREADHLSLVAGIRRSQRRALSERGVTTVEELGALELPPEPPLEGVSGVGLERIREQARIQVEGRRTGAARYELLLPVEEDRGLAALPEPSPGDLFFDIEGDPYAYGDGLEYLLGYVDREGAYTELWALDAEEERARFREFIDFVMARREEDPDLHIYHFHHYEETALKRLMGRHGTREDEVDRLLRGEVLVDLHRVVRQGLRASVESYSIKRLEPLYGFERGVDLREANRALAHFEAWLELGGGEGEDAAALLERIRGYNRDDCLSTLRLREWLEGLREEAREATGAPVPRPTPPDPSKSDEIEEQRAEVTALVEALTEGVPAEVEERTREEHARWLLAQLLTFHRREKKSAWWEYFRCLELDAEELIEDRATLGGLTYEGIVDTVKKSNIHRYRFHRQEHGISEGDSPHDPRTKNSAGTVHKVDDGKGIIDLRRGKRSEKPHPEALVPHNIYWDDVLRESLQRVARAVLEHGLRKENPFRAAVDLLMARPPRVRQAGGEALVMDGEETLEAARRHAIALEHSVLAIQGPPGTGKTFTGARMIVKLLDGGKRVGVTATSHQVIGNLLEAVCEAADEADVEVHGIQKAKEDQRCDAGAIESTNSNADMRDALGNGEKRLAGGTAWLWSREDMVGSVDVLFIDEAGQFSLANALAVAPAAQSVVLLGDPRQLAQPLQGVHPPGTDVSALEHLLEGEPTIAPARGMFLPETYRLHPDICRFTSEIFYRGRLESKDGLESQTVRGPKPLNGTGLRLVPVEHDGNQNESPEEVEVVARLVDEALKSGAVWVDKRGTERALRLEDILVVGPYNAQVSAIDSALPDGARVGTVDKFQGQEAPIVIYSMATSSAELAPRGMRFLYSGNRLNVATSRALCLTVVVASPEILGPECRSPHQMRLANAICRYAELARI